MSESPDQGLRLDDDVDRWLQELADRDFGGDAQLALNESLRAVMVAMREPQDPWAAVTWQARRKAQRSGRPLTDPELRQDL